MNLKRVQAIARKEFIQIIRDYRSLALAIVVPILLLILFGFALSLDVNNVPLVIWDQDKSQTSLDFLLNFKNSRYFKIVGYFDDYTHLQNYILRSKALMAMDIPKDFSANLHAGEAASVQLLVDGSDSNTATLAIGYVTSVISSYNVKLLKKFFSGRAAGVFSPIELRPRVWFNADLKSKNYIIPGLIAVIMMIIVAQLASITVAREWERGTMEQLISTPVKKGELLLGKFMPYFVVGFIDLLIAVGMTRFVFFVPLRGNLILLFIFSSIFLAGALAQGLYFSVFAKNQRLAMQLAILTTFLPTFLLSGFVYPIYNMPRIIQIITYALPARYFIVIIKGLYLKGEGLRTLWPQVLFLILFAVVMNIFTYRKFEKKIT